jgi:predicted unusual protein kinase regulating ubiquinone biosynthesis (AarF/ABC1/UbiB family)
MSPLARARRTVRVARAGLTVWGAYKLLEYARRAARRPPASDLSPTHARAARELLSLALDLRGVSIKLCQVMATRADVFPKEMVDALKQCHDAVPPQPFAVVRAAVETELGRPIDAVFERLDPTPLASASLAQVHRGVLLGGREVAVKVQYPGIDEIVRVDLANVRRACRVYEKVDPKPLELLPLLSELATYLELELDFRREAKNADRIRAIFADDPSVVIPQMIHELSTPRLIVMELVSGMKVTDKPALEAAGLRPADVMQDLMRIYTRMVFAAGFFQADPHPGNVFVKPDGRIVLVDFGLAKALPEGFGLGLFELMFSMMTMNEAAMIRAFDELGFETKTGDTRTFVELARRMVRRTHSGRFEGELTEEMTDELFTAIRENPVVRVPTDFVLVGRTFSLLSGIAHTLGRRANVLAAMGVV